MRRIAVLGSVLVGSTVLAAMGLAQNGEQRQKGSLSLADRLTALRQSAGTSSSESSPGSQTAISGGQGAERSVLATRQRFTERENSRPMPQNQGETASQERAQRPRLLDQLDPFNLLTGGDSSDATTEPADAPRRSSPAIREGASVRRDDAPLYTARSPLAVAEPTVERPYQARRSPLVRRAEEVLETSGAEAPQGVALGPAASESVTLPTLARPSAGSTPGVVVQDITPIRGGGADAVPYERPLEVASSNDSVAVASSEGTTGTPSQQSEQTSSAADRYSTTYSANDSVSAAQLEPEEDVLPIAEETADATELQAETQDTEAARVARAGGATASSIAATSQSEADGYDTAPTGGPSSADQVLSSDQAPAVAWEVAGPQKIIIGRDATFEVRLRNDGETPTQRLVARVEVPPSAEIISTEASHGVGQRVEEGETGAVLEWRVDQLAASREAVLRLTVVPRTSQVMHLQVSVRSEPRAAIARVEVLEPKLKLSLEGPSDVLHGEARSYRLLVANPGTGPAENVVVLFTPPGLEDRSAERHAVGLLKPGESKLLELEVTPQTAGDVAMKAVATADNDLRDLAERRVLVRKPELVVDARGPQTTYAGTVATYYFRVQNTGDATANDVTVKTHLPLGAEFIRATDDRKMEPVAEEEMVTWTIGSLPPGEEYFMELKCVVNWAGDNTLEVAADADKGNLASSKSITTHVVALADLKLEVSDPKGPVAVGKEALYEVRVRNRGSNTAEQVNVVALFSEGIEPIGVEGGQHSIENGRVAFRTIEGLPAGREIVFKIRAIAKNAGTHVFRAEVLCRELETKLAAEETTRFYLDQSANTRPEAGFQAAAGTEEESVAR